MNIEITGQNINIGQSLHNYVYERVDLIVHKYFAKINEAKIVFSKRGFDFTCHISVPNEMGKHFIIKGEGLSSDAYSAFDSAIYRIEKQLRKYKGKIKDHHKNKGIKGQDLITPVYTSTDYILEHGVFNPETGDFEEFEEPNIIDKKVTEIAELEINDAIMKMDLENMVSLVFVNTQNNRINVVYRDNLGRICLVDPQNKI